jgi:protein phosphatase
MFVLPILLILGIGAAALAYYAHNSYFVTLTDGKVTLYRGRPGGVLWWDPEVLESTNIRTAQLSQGMQDNLGSTREFSDKTAAEQFLANIRADRAKERRRAAAAAAATTTTTTTTPGTAGTTASSSPTSAP